MKSEAPYFFSTFIHGTGHVFKVGQFQKSDGQVSKHLT